MQSCSWRGVSAAKTEALALVGFTYLGATGSTLGSAQEGSMTQGWGGSFFISQTGSSQAPRSVRDSQALGGTETLELHTEHKEEGE